MRLTMTAAGSWMVTALLAAAATLSGADPVWAQVAVPVAPPPPRDAAPAAKHTAAISGRVTNLETSGPLRRALIRITSAALPSPASVSTNSDGRYEVRDLPPGEYSLKAERGGYLALAYGQHRPGEPGKPLRLAEGETARAIDFALPRVGVISGRIVDETGEPIAQVGVWAMHVRYFEGARKLIPVLNFDSQGRFDAHSVTDDSGQYRLVLPPGDFVVMGHSNETWPLDKDPTQVLGYPPSFYPGVIAASEAQRVKVAVGQQVENVDFALVPARTSRVSGTVFTAAGLPLANEPVTFRHELRGQDGGAVFSGKTVRTGPDGRFSATNVQAGEYLLAVRTPAAGDQPAQEARQVIQVAGADIDGLVLVTGSGGTVRGRVTSDDGTPVPGLDRLDVRPRALTYATRMLPLGSPGNGRVNADGTFALQSVAGPALLSIRPLTGDWTLKAVELDGRDLADDPIEVTHGQTISGVRIVLTNRPTLLRGGLLDEKQRPADGTVIVFTEETSRWREDSRRVRAARPDQRGEFSIKGLPAGKYLIAAVDYVQDGQWFDPEFLAELRPRAAELSLADAETRRIDLTVRK